jgi:hypothetical protein
VVRAFRGAAGLERFLPSSGYRCEGEEETMVTTRCVLCGAENTDEGLLCRHHTVGEQDWAAVNRLFCNFVHRGIAPAYPAPCPTEEPWLILDVDVETEEMMAMA